LEPMLDYISAEDVPLIRDALTLAFDAHAGQLRKSGEPFITHPVEVTRILAELHMDTESLVAGLLHDTVEDCGEQVGLEEIGFHFGQGVMKIVEGETKFSKLPTHHPERAQAAANGGDTGDESPSTLHSRIAGVNRTSDEEKAQDLQFLFLAMTEEVRIIVVKLADRLHNMRTMASMPQTKQRRIALETLQVFSPLARLLGLYTIKEELEELSFQYAMPQQYAITQKAVNRLWETQRVAVEAAARELEDKIESDMYLTGLLQGIKIEISRKALYSIWKKLQDSGRSIRDVSEIAQLRVILNPVNSSDERQVCYHTMGLIHSFWAPVPGSMKDYIATPKPNNYQSLHTAIVPTGLFVNGNGGRLVDHQATNGVSNGVSNGKADGFSSTRRASQSPNRTLFPIEVQIKTECMERLAQFGIAIEKQENNSDASTMTRRINWLNSIKQWQEEFVDTLTAQEFVDCVTDDFLGQGVFVFTPSGQVMRLPKGASVVDFAYHIHTDIGNTMVTARVNGKIVPAEHRLVNAEVVEIITYNGPPNANIVRRHQMWLDAAQTKSARHKILKFLKDNAHFLTKGFGSTDQSSDDEDILTNGTEDAKEASKVKTCWVSITCIDRPALLADISNVISRYNQNILSYEGRRGERGERKFVMKYELEGPSHLCAPLLVDGIAQVESVLSWSAWCDL
jgi:GTP pyrophosphokinase